MGGTGWWVVRGVGVRVIHAIHKSIHKSMSNSPGVGGVVVPTLTGDRRCARSQ